MRIAVNFPGMRVQTLPEATISVPVVVSRAGGIVASAELTRDKPGQTFSDLPAGDLTVYAAAVGSDQQVLALGKTTTTLQAGRLTQAPVEMLPLLVFSGDERLSIMASLRKGFPLNFGLQLRPLPPGDQIVPGSKPSPRPSSGPVSLGTLNAEPLKVTIGYPVVLSVGAEGLTGDLASWEFQWSGGSADPALTIGRISATTIRGTRAETIWTPDAAGSFVFRVTATDGTNSATSNDVTVTVTKDTGGATVGGTF